MQTNPGDEPDLAAIQGSGTGAPQAAEAKGAFAVVRAALDPYSVRILVATNDRECTAFDLSRGLGIPIVACYRRIRQLEALGLITPSRVTMSSAGHPVRLYRCHLKSARVVFEDGELRAQIEWAPPGRDTEADARLTETFDHGPARRKRSRAPRDFGYAGAALELVAEGGQGALDPGEAGG